MIATWDPDLPPHRLCCGQRHFGVQCPDGLVMCCLCFSRFPVSELHVDPSDGRRVNVCTGCEAIEEDTRQNGRPTWNAARQRAADEDLRRLLDPGSTS